jgi:hypothetical protein
MGRKCKPFTAAWNKSAKELALIHAPTIEACVDCYAPIVEGYCCSHCGSRNGGVSEDEYDPRPARASA